MTIEYQGGDQAAIERARAALNYLDPSCDHATWKKYGMALKHEFGDAGFEIWVSWSEQSEKYSVSVTRSAWKSFKQSGKVTIASMFFDAKRFGWKEDTTYKKPSAAEIEQRRKERAERDAVAAQQEMAAQDAAAVKAQALWDVAEPCDTHPYLERKGVKSHGLRYGKFEIESVDHDNGEVNVYAMCELLVPIMDHSLKIWTLQAISAKADGRKSLLKGGRKSGNFFAIGSNPQMDDGRPVFILVEGYATGASVHEATEHLVLCCFDTSNLLPVARALREREPDAIILFGADNDLWTAGNPGMKAAQNAAQAVGGLVCGPSFSEADQCGVDLKGSPAGPTDWNDWAALHGAESIASAIARALAMPLVTLAPEPELPVGVEPAKRRTIEVVPGELGAVVDAGELALLEQCPDLYQRGGQIVRSVRGELSEVTHSMHGTQVAMSKLHALNKHSLVEALTQAADWVKSDGRRRSDNEIVRVDCPMNIAETLLARGEWKLRTLTAIINAPTLRADGSVLDATGYDCKTGLLLEPSAKYDPIPEAPTRCEARAAMQRLSALVSKFPFAAPEDLSVWLAAVLTACVRRSLSTAPMFAFSAPAAGSGKSLLVDLVAVIATGTRAPVFSQGRDEAEMEKRLSSALLAGHGVVSIDNCTLAIDGDLLCQALTQPLLTIRPLGGSTTRTVPASATFFANGNSLVIAGDMTRRVLLCSLDAGQERPELRQFDFNPLEQAMAGRAGFLEDALTILRAFHVAGRPKQPGAPLGSFEVWSDFVRGALLWLELDDPVRTMERTRNSDPKLSALRVLMSEWASVFGEKPVPAREAIEVAMQLKPSGFEFARAFALPDFHEALMTVAGVGGRINSRTLGKWLGSNKGRIVDGKRLQHHGMDRNGIAKWSVQEL